MPLGVDLTRLRTDLGVAPAQVFESLCIHLFPAILEEDFGPVTDGTLLPLRPPDGGLEACARLTDGRLVGIQVKYHATSGSALQSMDESVKSALTHHPDLTDLLVFLPQDFTGGGRGTPGTEQWRKATDRWAAAVRNARPGQPIRFHPYTRSTIERVIAARADEIIPAYFDTPYLRLSDIHRHAAAAARTVRRRQDRVDLPSPLLATFLSDTLSELHDPSSLITRLTGAATTLRIWSTWQPQLDRLPVPCLEPMAAAARRWAASVEQRDHCADQLDVIARLLSEAGELNAEPLRRAITSALRLCGQVAVEVHAVHRELLSSVSVARPYESLPDQQHRALGGVIATLKDLLACIRGLYAVCADSVLATRQTGSLLVGGGWGTGKSYGLGCWVQERLAQGAPTAFVCGHEFGPAEPFEAQLPRLVAPGTAPRGLRDLLAALQQQALLTGRHAVLAVDALNEVRCLRGDFQTAFASLADLVRGYPLVTLVGTVRLDTRPTVPEQVSDEVDRRGHGFLWNPGISEPDRAWRVYQDMYGLPELLLPPDLSELRRPLMLAVLAWYLHRNPRPEPGPIVPPSVGDLFKSWLRILDSDYAAYLDEAHGLRAGPSPAPPPLVDLVCEALAEQMGEEGTLDYPRACRALAEVPGSAEPAVMLRWLEGAGVLALDPDTRRVRFAIQRFAEHVRAVNLLLGRHPARAVTRLVKAVAGSPDDEPESARSMDRRRMLEALAGATPQVIDRAELSDLVPRRLRSAVARTVLDSMEGRSPEHISPSSRAFLARQLRDPDSAPGALYSILVNATCHRHPLGVPFLDEQLSSWSRRRVELRFAGPVVALLDDEDGIVLLRRLIAWAGSVGPRGDEVVAEVSTLLLRLAAVGHHGLRDACIRTAADLLVDRPELIARHLTRFGHDPDECLAEAAWLVAYGALARSTQSITDIRVSVAVDRSLSRPHLRIHDAVLAVREVLRGEQTADSRFPAVPLRRPRMRALPFGSRTIALEAGRLSWCPFEEESPVPRQVWLARRAGFLTLGLPRRLFRTSDELHPDASSAVVSKALQRAQQEWYAEQASRLQEGAPSPGSDEHAAARHHQRTIDPTLGAEWRTTSNSRTRKGNWWTAPFSAADLAGSADGPPVALSRVLTRIDPAGTPWLLLNAFHHLAGEEDEPGPDLPRLHRQRAILRTSDAWQRSSPAHKPRTFLPVLRVDSFLMSRTAAIEALARRSLMFKGVKAPSNWPGEAFLAEYYIRAEFAEPHGSRTDPMPTSVEIPEIRMPPPGFGRFAGAVSRPVPSRRLTDRLEARWTGRRLDFTDRSSGELVLTDPGFAGAGPNSILLRQSAVERLLGEERVLLWSVQLTEHSPILAPSWSAYCVLDPDGFHTLPFAGPPTGGRLNPSARWPDRGLAEWPPAVGRPSGPGGTAPGPEG
ncbi:hypothetical protein [Kitasatospora sp. NPDC094011]|uniref:hypothetical protein n=1 Tax=Kitasatospora sp. NPDC094011 TaxID=3364090 RepID=UPI0037F1ABEF